MPVNSFEGAKRNRDERMRRLMLEVLNDAKAHAPTHEIGGLTLMDEAEARSGETFDDDSHFLGLCADLANFGVAESRFEGLHRGDRYAPRHVVIKIAAKGLQLLNESIPPIPGIWDERIVG